MLVGYMRVSSDGDRQVLDLQRDALLNAGVDERHLFEDHASGSRDNRAGLTKALAFLRPGDCLVVWKLDRLGRSLSHLLATVNGLKDRGIAFRSLTERMDTTTPQGAFLFHVFGALAQFERSLTQERVRAGLAAARRRGRRHQGGGLSHIWRQAQHPHRLAGADRLVSGPQDPGGISDTTAAAERSPDRRTVRSSYRST
jgi:DNA invertase Pin-like site-specific DNA recombinase